ncbi:MAG: VanZ family protein [Terriglobales bacterium]
MKRILKAWLPVIAMCVVIFLFSQDANSGRHSAEVLGWLLSLAGLDTHHMLVLLNGPFRKFAHVVVYFLLGLLVYRGFSMDLQHFSLKAGWRTLVFCLLYASSDEIHQSLVPSRGPSPRDVAIDTSASVLAMLLIWGWLHLRTRRRQHRSLPEGNTVLH